MLTQPEQTLWLSGEIVRMLIRLMPPEHKQSPLVTTVRLLLQDRLLLVIHLMLSLVHMVLLLELTLLQMGEIR